MAATKEKVSPYRAITKAPKAGVSLITVADKTGLPVLTVRREVQRLLAEGKVVIVGKVTSGKRGRPAFLFAKASA